MNVIDIYGDVGQIKGIGPKKSERLAAIGISTVADLIDHFPVRYEDRRALTPSIYLDESKAFMAAGRLLRKRVRHISGHRSFVEFYFSDDAGRFEAVFFNMPYLMRSLDIGKSYTLYGKIRNRGGRKIFQNPEFAKSGSEGDVRGIIPIYRCTFGVTNRDFRKWISFALEFTDLGEWLDPHIVEENRLCSESYAYNNIHFPKSNTAYAAAKYRLTYDVMLTYQIAVKRNRMLIRSGELDASISDEDISVFIGDLGFELTEGQNRAICDIEKDLIAKAPMNRLIQGDVGCGKTVIAEAAMYKVAKAGAQSVFMAPTELLAEQHYREISDRFGKYGFEVRLLVSGLKAAERRSIIDKISNGIVKVIVGTHACIQGDVEFDNLALVITDEQHRFGVNQRKALIDKSRVPNVLVMSATPIPRTLAATVFGDMDFSVIKSMPRGRVKIITRSLGHGARSIAYLAVERELKSGHQAYVVAPSIDAREDSELESVEELNKELGRKFKGWTVEIIHGQMPSKDKERIMNAFIDGDIDLLISTVVIEVGIDVPNATIIVVENCERFGLAQLHQLRGRVGRSEYQSYCYLINYGNSELAKDRADAMVRISNGFEISEADFRLRGPGDVMGTSQHGVSSAFALDIHKYNDIFQKAVNDADVILGDYKDDTDRNAIEKRLEHFYKENYSEII